MKTKSYIIFPLTNPGWISPDRGDAIAVVTGHIVGPRHISYCVEFQIKKNEELKKLFAAIHRHVDYCKYNPHSFLNPLFPALTNKSGTKWSPKRPRNIDQYLNCISCDAVHLRPIIRDAKYLYNPSTLHGIQNMIDRMEWDNMLPECVRQDLSVLTGEYD